MKPKYKIGTLVRTESDTFVVDAVVTRSTGYSYLPEGGRNEVMETEITQAFRAILPRKTKVMKTKKRRTENSLTQ